MISFQVVPTEVPTISPTSTPTIFCIHIELACGTPWDGVYAFTDDVLGSDPNQSVWEGLDTHFFLYDVDYSFNSLFGGKRWEFRSFAEQRSLVSEYWDDDFPKGDDY